MVGKEDRAKNEGHREAVVSFLLQSSPKSGPHTGWTIEPIARGLAKCGIQPHASSVHRQLEDTFNRAVDHVVE